MFISYPLHIRIALTALFAAAAAYLVTPSVRDFAVGVNALDVPGERRRVHDRTVPRMGGIAIFLALAAALLVFSDLGTALVGVLEGAAIIALMGAVDDALGLRAPLKLMLQLIAALIAWRAGARIEVLSVPLSAAAPRFVALGALSLPVTLLWVTACTNAINLIDGLDGLAAGVAAIGAFAMLLVAAIVGEGEIAVLLAAIAGACLGFLPYNRSPAVVFMGDAGSQMLGYMLSAAAMLGMFKAHALLTFFVPLLALALPLFDTVFAFLRRLARGADPFAADRGHIHHRLLDLGLDQRQAVTVLYGVSALTGLLAVLTADRGRSAGAACGTAIMLACAVGLAAIRKRMLVPRKKRR